MNFPTLTLFDIVPPKFFIRLALSVTLIFTILASPLFVGAMVVLSARDFRQTMSIDIGSCSALIAVKRDLPPFFLANDTLVAGGWCVANPHLLILRDAP
jgi:hypothetical protein